MGKQKTAASAEQTVVPFNAPRRHDRLYQNRQSEEVSFSMAGASVYVSIRVAP
jgi:hypothetical protein